ncbi:MAG: hypothetical protein KU37_06730 [Sulfuricurvum sp. PC08-66]|nr:MAG: hypothetical protein KU37_06730 [Sulfuricurvum sp. PC08-66]
MQPQPQSLVTPALDAIQQGRVKEGYAQLLEAAYTGDKQAQSLIAYVSNAALATSRNEAFHTLDPLEQEAIVRAIIDEHIAPPLLRDGGGVTLVNYIAGENPQIWLRYLGACAGCHLSTTSTADMMLGEFEKRIDKNVVLYLLQL